MGIAKTLSLLEQARSELTELSGQLAGTDGAANAGGDGLGALGYVHEFSAIAEELHALQVRIQETWASLEASGCVFGK